MIMVNYIGSVFLYGVISQAHKSTNNYHDKLFQNIPAPNQRVQYKDHTLSSHKKPHSLLLQVSYCVSIVSIFEKIDHATRELKCGVSTWEFSKGQTKIIFTEAGPCLVSVHYLWYNQIKPDHFVVHSWLEQ